MSPKSNGRFRISIVLGVGVALAGGLAGIGLLASEGGASQLAATCITNPGSPGTVGIGCPQSTPSSTPPSTSAHFTPISVPPAPEQSDPAGVVTPVLSAPMSGSDGTFTTEWWNEIGGMVYRVFAGSTGSNTLVGTVLVEQYPSASGYEAETDTFYPLSTSSGALTLTGSSGLTLTLSSAAGGSYQFDLGTDSFSGS
jgi:hypothetical protein